MYKPKTYAPSYWHADKDDSGKPVPGQLGEVHTGRGDHKAYVNVEEGSVPADAPINKVYAAKMRERGWPLLDLDASDFERMQQDDEYRADREAKLAQHGLPTNEYIAKQHLEQQLDWLDEAMDYTDEFEGRARRAKAELADI